MRVVCVSWVRAHMCMCVCKGPVRSAHCATWSSQIVWLFVDRSRRRATIPHRAASQDRRHYQLVRFSAMMMMTMVRGGAMVLRSWWWRSGCMMRAERAYSRARIICHQPVYIGMCEPAAIAVDRPRMKHTYRACYGPRHLLFRFCVCVCVKGATSHKSIRWGYTYYILMRIMLRGFTSS